MVEVHIHSESKMTTQKWLKQKENQQGILNSLGFLNC